MLPVIVAVPDTKQAIIPPTFWFHALAVKVCPEFWVKFVYCFITMT
jgi:hypothetical protein